MSEEMTVPSRAASSTSDVPPASEGRELNELRKEVIEARNLIIKTDNLLKNMHAEIKKMGMRQEDFGRRRFFSSATAYVLFAAIAIIGAFAVARSDSAQEREKSGQNEARAHQLQTQVEQLQGRDAARKDVSEKAARIYEELGAEKEGPGLNQAMSNAVRMDRQLLSGLETKAMEDRVASMKSAVAQGALDRGQRAYKMGDWKTAATELGRYVELAPGQAEPLVNFHLGHARAMDKQWAGVVTALELFLKSAPGSKTAQTAGFYLGQAYEELGSYSKAAEAYQRSVGLYPGSELAPLLRARIRRLPSLQAAATTAQGQAPAAQVPLQLSAPADAAALRTPPLAGPPGDGARVTGPASASPRRATP